MESGASGAVLTPEARVRDDLLQRHVGRQQHHASLRVPLPGHRPRLRLRLLSAHRVHHASGGDERPADLPAQCSRHSSFLAAWAFAHRAASFAAAKAAAPLPPRRLSADFSSFKPFKLNLSMKTLFLSLALILTLTGLYAANQSSTDAKSNCCLAAACCTGGACCATGDCCCLTGSCCEAGACSCDAGCCTGCECCAD